MTNRCLLGAGVALAVAFGGVQAQAQYAQSAWWPTGTPLGPVKVTGDVVCDWLVRLVHPPSGPIYQAHGVPVGHHADCAYCACA